MSENAAVRANLDGALEDLVRMAIEVGPELDAVTCDRIDHVFARRMADHKHLAWALAEAEVLKRQLKAGLHGQALHAVGGADDEKCTDMGEQSP